jgi:hypothetical protein
MVEMKYKQENFDKLSLADLIALHGYCEQWINFYEQTKQERQVYLGEILED